MRVGLQSNGRFCIFDGKDRIIARDLSAYEAKLRVGGPMPSIVTTPPEHVVPLLDDRVIEAYYEIVPMLRNVPPEQRAMLCEILQGLVEK